MSKLITTKNKSHVDSMVIGSGHSIMIGHVPEVMSNKDGISKLVQNFFSWNGTSQESVQALGFFGSDIDYNTYYPDLKAEDLTPKGEEFIEPMFRLLSATIVSKNFNPTDFSNPGVLKSSMKMLLGQTVNCDHETNIGNAIGSVSKVVWQEAYKEGNFEIPAGINGVLKIDGKANPRIARGILMDPPSIHSNSVTVQFRWDKSHPEMDDRDFYEKLGTYDEKGNMIRRMVTEVVRYMETSLVSHGADYFAQKIGADGKIINPEYAKKAWNSYSEYMGDDSRQYFFMDNKSYNFTSEVVDDTQSTIIENPDSQKSINSNKMNQELKEFLDKLFGKDMLTLGEGKESTQEEAISLIKSMVAENASLKEQKTNLETEKTTLSEQVTQLESQVTSLKEMSDLGKSYVTSLREKAVADYKKIQGDKFDEKDPVFIMLNADTTPLVTLKGLQKSYEQRLEELFPMKCSHCGSTDFSRASSVVEDTDKPKEDTTKNSEVPTTAQAAENILQRKNRYQGIK